MSDGVSLDESGFKSVVSTFPTGITVVTTVRDGEPVGLTVSSFTSVSLNPPLVLFCIDRRSDSLVAFQIGTEVVINVLASDQSDIAHRFANDRMERFAPGVLEDTNGDSRGKLPTIDGVAAKVAGTVVNEYDGGDHVIFLIGVEKAWCCDKEPLLYARSRIHVRPWSRWLEGE